METRAKVTLALVAECNCSRWNIFQDLLSELSGLLDMADKGVPLSAAQSRFKLPCREECQASQSRFARHQRANQQTKHITISERFDPPCCSQVFLFSRGFPFRQAHVYLLLSSLYDWHSRSKKCKDLTAVGNIRHNILNPLFNFK